MAKYQRFRLPGRRGADVARDGSSAGALSYEAGKIVTGKYKIGKQLGRGGFGAVYAAENMATSHNVAIKVLAIDPDDTDDSMIQRFLQEAQVTAKLKHPNTIRIFDFGQTDEGALFMVMEMLNGPTLEQLLKDNARNGTTMAERETLNLAIPVLRSLAEAHDNALVHRDLKPLNIMLTDASDDERIVKVLDFGIARKADSQLTGTGKALGTPAHMSPEQCKGGNLDGRSDLYALGTIMFRCVTGRLPFVRDNQLALLQAQINEMAPDVRECTKQTLSDGFVACLERVLQKDPRSRFENAKAMRQELEAVLGGAWAGTPVHPMDVVEEEPPETRMLDVGATHAVAVTAAEKSMISRGSTGAAQVAGRSKSSSGTQVLDAEGSGAAGTALGGPPARVGAGLRARPESATPIPEKLPEINQLPTPTPAVVAPGAAAPAAAAPAAQIAPVSSPRKAPAHKAKAGGGGNVHGID